VSAPLQREPYQPSGRQGRTLLLPVFALLSAGVTGSAYGTLQAHTLCLGFGIKLFLFWLVLRGAMVLAFAFATTWPVVLGGRLLAVRSTLTMRIYGAATGALAVWFAWLCFVSQVVVDHAGAPVLPVAALGRDPLLLVSAIDALAHDGLHLMANFGGAWMPTGLYLWVPWALEAAAVVWLCMRAAPCLVSTRGYCEDCGRWLRPLPPLVVAADSTTGASPRDVRRNGLAVLQAVEPPQRDSLRSICLEQQRCPGCGRGVWRALEQLHYTHTSPLRAVCPEHLVRAAAHAPRCESQRRRGTALLVDRGRPRRTGPHRRGAGRASARDRLAPAALTPIRDPTLRDPARGRAR
jgi:hypothetical protein